MQYTYLHYNQGTVPLVQNHDNFIIPEIFLNLQRNGQLNAHRPSIYSVSQG